MVGFKGPNMADDFDLYEFPAGFAGRKTYVSVRGHSRSIPVCYTYRGADRRNYVLPEFGGDVGPGSGAGPSIMRDIGEYQSVVDGSFISSRSSHREHIRRHDLVELGNDRPKYTAARELPRVGHDIKRAFEQIRSR